MWKKKAKRMLRALALVLLPLAAADGPWVEIDSGPFRMLSLAGDRPAREVLNQLEQLRHALGTVLGKPDLKTIWPVDVLVFKGPRQPVAPRLARDRYVAALPANAPAPRAWMRECARILLESNTPRMPPGIDKGLLDFYSTIEANGPRLTLGQPPPPAERDLNWARIHLLQVHPDYYGKLRVLLYNLQQGVDLEPAYRNAFGKTPAEIDKLASEYLAAGNFGTIPGSGRPINPRIDFRAKTPEPPVADVALADLKLREGQGRAAYEALLKTAPAAAHEGLGLVALGEKREEDARKEFAAAVEAGSTSARAWAQFGRLHSDSARARAALEKAAQLNPNWAEPHFLLAAREPDANGKVQQLDRAARLEPRTGGYWRTLAEAALAANKYPEAAKAWAAAENASADDSERARIREARRGIEQQRLEYEAAERKRREEERQREIQRLKDAAMAEVRAAEQRANRGDEPTPGRKLEIWWGDGEGPSGKARGRLIRVDCLRGLLRLVVEAGGKPTQLLIRDPRKVIVVGGGELLLDCGRQRTPRTVAIEYFPKNDPKLGTAGEIATIEYIGGAGPNRK